MSVQTGQVEPSPRWWGMLITGEAVHVCDQGVHEKSLDLRLNFAVNLKLLQKTKNLKNPTVMVIHMCSLGLSSTNKSLQVEYFY